MEYSQLHKKIELYVTKLFEENYNGNLVFHNLNHTLYVVEKANEIAGNYRLSDRERLILHTTAWFHDTGYLFVSPEEHEERSVEVMKTFFQQHEYDVSIVEAVSDCILATRYPTSPHGLLQEIICDADTFNFGTKDFKVTNKLMFKELNNIKLAGVDKDAFNRDTYKMLQHHRYYTSYCQNLLEAGKKANMKKLEKKLTGIADEPEELPDDESSLVITEKEGTTKGMQTMLRLTSSNHNALSEMADSKANILISVNSIIISIILSVLLRKLQTEPYLVIPTLIFLAVSVTTIVIAILSTRPKITQGTFSQDDLLSKKTNLLFFGNFYKVDLPTYEKAMRTMMRDADYLYRSMIKDIYFLGVVLGKKYRLLRLAYNIFMYGLIVSVIAFAVAAFLNSAPPASQTVTNATGSPF